MAKEKDGKVELSTDDIEKVVGGLTAGGPKPAYVKPKVVQQQTNAVGAAPGVANPATKK